MCPSTTIPFRFYRFSTWLVQLCVAVGLFVARPAAAERGNADAALEGEFLKLGKATRYQNVAPVIEGLKKRGLPAVRKAGEILVDDGHAVRIQLSQSGVPSTFFESALIDILADSGAANVAPVLVRYGWQRVNPDSTLFRALGRLPQDPKAVAYLKQHFLNTGRQAGPAGVAAAWRDFGLMEWMAEQSKLLNRSELEAAAIAKKAAMIGNAIVIRRFAPYAQQSARDRAAWSCPA